MFLAKGFVVFLATLISVSAFADLWIFDSRRPVALSDDEHPARDYYINGGSEQGLKAGLIVTVRRRLTLYDSLANRSPGDLIVPVGKVKIIHVQKGLSVARLHSLSKGPGAAALEENFLMVGDRLDLGSAEADQDKGEAAAEAPAALAPKNEAIASALPTKVEVTATVLSSVAAAPAAPPPATAAPQEQQKSVPVPQVQ